jgi:predicted AlkP superfamily pyrophosphatase or phosphodiesterase
MLLEKIDQGLFKPDYENFSLVNLSNFVLKHFNAQISHAPYPFERFISGVSNGVEKIVFFLIDALGMSSLEKILNKDRVFQEYVVLEATSVFPTTTSAAITSLLTASTPIEHGVLG